MKAGDFTLDRVDGEHGHEDYWFKVSGDTERELTEEYMEQSMVSVTECVYSKDEDIVGVKRLFPFNFNVVISDNEELKQILKRLVQ